MPKSRIISVFVLAAIACVAPATVFAQEQPASPEGLRWDLTAYAADGELVPVPWTVDAMLQLDAGVASGDGGCNGFEGTYVLDGQSLTFGDEFAVTLAACPEPETNVEDAYLGALRTVATWAITEEDVLELSDDSGEVALVFQQPSITLTAGEMAGLLGTIDELRSDVDRLSKAAERNAKLRKQVSTLKAELKNVRTELRAQRARAAEPKPAAFTSAEQVLRKGVPAAIRKTCVPRRSQNPAGTIAALQCAPRTSAVADMAYYLMDGPDASKVFEQRMDQNGVKDTGKRCSTGQKTKTYWIGGVVTTEGCYRNDNGKANLRFLEPANGCRQVKADGSWIKRPTIYVAVLGPDGDIAKLADWATADGTANPSVLTRAIKQPNAPFSPACPS
ncbi:MAG: META domain-containing protein [Chloroflexota bacterium]|jgi:heat shock protein HslJ